MNDTTATTSTDALSGDRGEAELAIRQLHDEWFDASAAKDLEPVRHHTRRPTDLVIDRSDRIDVTGRVAHAMQRQQRPTHHDHDPLPTVRRGDFVGDLYDQTTNLLAVQGDAHVETSS